MPWSPLPATTHSCLKTRTYVYCIRAFRPERRLPSTLIAGRAWSLSRVGAIAFGATILAMFWWTHGKAWRYRNSTRLHGNNRCHLHSLENIGDSEINTTSVEIKIQLDPDSRVQLATESR